MTHTFFKQLFILLLMGLVALPAVSGETQKRVRQKCKVPKQRTMMKNMPPTDCDGSRTVISSDYNALELYQIPVVVHVIYNSEGVGRLTEEKVVEMIEILNQDFRAAAGTDAAQGVNTMVQFFLADKDPNGAATNGITFTENDTWFVEAEESDRADYGEALAWDTDRYLNIFTTGMEFALGYVVSMPWEGSFNAAEDGVAILYESAGLNNTPGAENGHTLTHEVGHYLGLDHTFGWGDECPTGDCYSTGDFICDTNPHHENQGCDDVESCGVPEPINNYMSYSDDVCMNQFTGEQINRMRCTLLNYRSGLIQTTTPPAETPTRWINHVTAAGGSFSSQIMAKNTGTSSAQVTFTGYDIYGTAIDGAEATWTVAGSGFTSMDISNLFNPYPSDLSHLGISGSSSVRASVAYRVADGNGASAHINEDSSSSTKWYFYPGEQSLVFDGVAALNVGSSDANVSLRLLDGNGNATEIATNVIANLAPSAKGLIILSSHFSNPEGKVIEITSTQPVQVIALRGSNPGGATYLYQTVPIKGN